MKRYDLYLKYVEILRQIHVHSKNNVSAAHTITLFAVLLNWTNEQIDSSYLKHCKYSNIKHHKDLKEKLFIDIIEDFTIGQVRNPHKNPLKLSYSNFYLN